MQVTIMPIKDIQIGDRQRKRMDSRQLSDLAWSIHTHGLLQAVGVWEDPTTNHYHLVWGGRRTAAVSKLVSEGKTIRAHDGTAIPLGHIPAVVFAADSLLERREAELAENVAREDIAWQDRAQALAEIHALRQSVNPAQTIKATAEELVSTASPSAAPSVSQTRAVVSKAVIVSKRMDDPDVAKAKGLDDAFQIIQRKDAQRATAQLVLRRKAQNPSDQPIKLLCNPWESVLCTDIVSVGSIDLVLTDPPFGVNAQEDNFSKRQAVRHGYGDSPEKTLPMLQGFLLAAFKVARQRANLFMFCDIDHFVWLRDCAARMGWTPFRTPVVWDKMHQGIGPWQTEGFQRRYDLILFATKGAKGLNAPIPDIIQARRVPPVERIHAAQKPVELLRVLIESTTLFGDVVLDPFAGSGSTLVACKALGRRAIGIEADKDTYTSAVANVFGSDEDFA